MTKSGTIKLIRSTVNRDLLVSSLMYKSIDQRNRIINDWIKLHGQKIEEYFFQIVPDIEPEPPKIIKKKEEMTDDAPKPILRRPPAIYDNTNRSLYPTHS